MDGSSPQTAESLVSSRCDDRRKYLCCNQMLTGLFGRYLDLLASTARRCNAGWR